MNAKIYYNILENDNGDIRFITPPQKKKSKPTNTAEKIKASTIVDYQLGRLQ